MKYLLFYYKEKLIQFPIHKKKILIGRGKSNDLIINNEFISRKHLKINVLNDRLEIIDLNSKNGLMIGNKKLTEAVVRINESFEIGGIEFVLKEGCIDDFKVEEDLIPIFNKMAEKNKDKMLDTKTKYSYDIFNELIMNIIKKSMKHSSFNEFIMDIPSQLTLLKRYGSLYLIEKTVEDEYSIIFSLENEELTNIIEKIIKNNFEYEKNLINIDFNYNNTSAKLIFIHKNNKFNNKINIFLKNLSSAIKLAYNVLRKPQKRKHVEIKTKLPIDIIAEDTKMKELINQTKKLAKADNLFVLIEGESGTGKELIAKLIHKLSKRAYNNFVAINCAAIPENLLESELFGNEKGAFTDATSQRKGKLELASNGTLVLDEIGEMPLNLQSKLLRVLQEQEFYRVGGNKPIKVNLRVISLTNKNLIEEVKKGNFREDLYYRIAHRTIVVPPLRERRGDISVLINFFLNKYLNEINKEVKGFSQKAFYTLINYNWPGNVRQLENEIKTLVNLTDDREIINYNLISKIIRDEFEDEKNEKKRFRMEKNNDNEKRYVLEILKKNKGNKTKAAKEIGITYRGLLKKLERLNITNEMIFDYMSKT